MAKPEKLFEKLNNSFQKYRTNFAVSKNIKYSELETAINSFQKKGVKTVVLGRSVEGRKIHRLTWGSGKCRLLLWSQMHGDEPTATKSILDVLDFLCNNDEFDELRDIIRQELTIHFIPMLNPDGSEQITRENAIGVDLNRDASKLVSPESQILLEQVESIRPEFAFNLHDQDTRWAVGETSTLATISLLAPPYDYNKSVDEFRLNSIKLNAKLYTDLNQLLPGGIARYSDDHEPRSFGDTIAGKKVSTILIESGRCKNDPDREVARRLNFVAYLSAFESIANKSVYDFDETIYDEIPNNDNILYDLVMQGIIVRKNNSEYKIDIGINFKEKYEGPEKIKHVKILMEVGDLKNTSSVNKIDFCERNVELLVEGEFLINSEVNFKLIENGKEIDI